jgi:TetR/AcrR family transcriptional regulator, cholesterol catabolism regulator
MALDRKEQIYSTARSMFSERDIARELNMQGGSLYAHIESKEDVLWEIVNRAADQFLGAVEPIVASDRSPADKLREMVRVHVGVVADNLENATVFLHEWKFLSEERRAAVAKRRDRYEHLYRQVIEEGIHSGAFAECDPKMAALLVLSVVNWLPQWYKPSGPLSPAEVADKFSDLILSGLEYTSGEVLQSPPRPNASTRKGPSKTNWAKVDELNDDDIDTSDVPQLTESFFSRAKVQAPRTKE